MTWQRNLPLSSSFCIIDNFYLPINFALVLLVRRLDGALVRGGPRALFLSRDQVAGCLDSPKLSLGPKPKN